MVHGLPGLFEHFLMLYRLWLDAKVDGFLFVTFPDACLWADLNHGTTDNSTRIGGNSRSRTSMMAVGNAFSFSVRSTHAVIVGSTVLQVVSVAVRFRTASQRAAAKSLTGKVIFLSFR